MREHEYEPIRGLPEPLPEGERILWQGSPDWKALAQRALHARKLAIYFGVLIVLRAVTVLSDGNSVGEAVLSAFWLIPLALVAVGLVALMAWLISRTSVYTITEQRIVMRIGVVLTIALNLPFRVIESAGLRIHSDGTGDIPLSLIASERVGYLHLWPHIRPWRLARAEPMLRAIPDAARVAETLSRALAASTGGVAQPLQIPAVPAGTDFPASESRPRVGQSRPLSAATR